MTSQHMEPEQVFGEKVGGFLRRWGSTIAVVISCLAIAVSALLWTQSWSATHKLQDATVALELQAGELEKATTRLTIEANNVHQNLIISCQRVGEPTRQAVLRNLRTNVDRLRADIAQRHALDYTQLFPSFDPEQLKALTDMQDQRDRANLMESQDSLDKLSAVPPCKNRFPDPDPARSPSE